MSERGCSARSWAVLSDESDGRALVEASSTSGAGFSAGPMQKTPLAIVDDKGKFTPIPVTPKAGYRPESVAVDAARSRSPSTSPRAMA